ncbi:MAG: M81 family metallopeptidase [Firmicutes bacterium]|nr:M81 family metallopeptidase [Bacillota bacterium]
MRIIYGRLGHEANTFSVEKGTFERFSRGEWVQEEEVYPKYKNSNNYLGGMIEAAELYGVELVPTVALENAAPVLTAECVEKTVGTLLSIIENKWKECDGICMEIHGAAVAEGIHDLDTYILREIRKIVGPDMPITICMDLHGNLAPEMGELCQGIFGIKEYPHTDIKEAGFLAMESLIKIIRGQLKLQTVILPLNMMIPSPLGITTAMPMVWFKDFVREYKERNKLYDAALFHGFPYADVPCCAASIVAVADEDNREKAEEAAREMAEIIYENRERFNITLPQPEEALEQAAAFLDTNPEGYVLINETSDNVGGGTPGDGTYLLRELLKRNIPGSVFGFIYDSEIALLAHEKGVGAVISGLLGGKTDNMHGEPVMFTDAKVCALSDGEMINTSPVVYNMPVFYGKSALLEIGNVKVVVTEFAAEQTFDDVPFTMVGVDLNQCRIVCIKSANHFHAFFDQLAAKIITTDPPGISTGNLKQLNYKNIKRPMWPLDR